MLYLLSAKGLCMISVLIGCPSCCRDSAEGAVVSLLKWLRVAQLGLWGAAIAWLCFSLLKVAHTHRKMLTGCCLFPASFDARRSLEVQ
jgi:hypothetical protein